MQPLGLALSGGGYRAAAYHLGTLKKLHELRILGRVNVLSTISGGSITGAAYALHAGDYLTFHEAMRHKLLTCNTIGAVLRTPRIFLPLALILSILVGLIYLLFTPWAWTVVFVLPLLVFLLLRFQFRFLPISDAIEKAYDNFFFHRRTLPELKGPLMAIGSSNLQTGRPFTFSADRMSDSTYAYYQPPIYFKTAGFPVARAVMASSCVPFAFTPISIAREFYQNPADDGRPVDDLTDGDVYHHEPIRIEPRLIDGGVYDNQGLQKLTQPQSRYECQTIIISDAGRRLTIAGQYRNTVTLLLRTVDLFMNRIKNVQMANLLYPADRHPTRAVAYQSLGWRLASCIPSFIDNIAAGNIPPATIEAHQLNPLWVAHPRQYQAQLQAALEARVDYRALEARNLPESTWRMACNIGTNLTCLRPAEVDALICHAENMTELQVRLYCPLLLTAPTDAPRPPAPALS
jgi:NTE family protein